MTVRILLGDVRHRLRELPDESVHCVVTSPPYWGLRNYDMPGQIGLEDTLWEHLACLVDVFRDVRRVLRKDGTVWLNYGDAYAGSWGAQSRGEACPEKSTLSGGQIYAAPKGTHTGSGKRTPGLKPKDRMLLPARLAIALCDDGWWLRDEIVWAKANPMPSSVADRTTPAHEMIYLLTRSARYAYDAKAIAEPAGYDPANTKFPDNWDTGPGGHGTVHRKGREKGKIIRSGNKARKMNGERGAPDNHLGGSIPWAGATRNKRSVWSLAAEPFPEAHFATFPSALVEPCILAGCPAGGTVLDPFGGAGTTGLVADRLGRNALLIELNPEYAAIAERRIKGDAPMFTDVAVSGEDTPLFGSAAQ